MPSRVDHPRQCDPHAYIRNTNADVFMGNVGFLCTATNRKAGSSRCWRVDSSRIRVESKATIIKRKEASKAEAKATGCWMVAEPQPYHYKDDVLTQSIYLNRSRKPRPNSVFIQSSPS